MSVELLMTRVVTIQRRDGGAKDKYGNEIPYTSSTVTVQGHIEQTSEQEITLDRETYISEWRIFLPAGTEIDGKDRVIVDGQTFEIIGPPAHPWRPGTGEHHVLCQARAITG